MDKKSKLNRIISVLDANNVPYDGDFRELLTRGYDSDGCQDLSDVLVDDIYKLTARGINDNFSRERDAIKELVSIAVKLGKRKAAAKLDKYKKQRDEILSDVKDRKVKEENMDIKGEVLKYIEVAEEAAGALGMQEINDNISANLERSLQLLGELRELVSGVFDNGTKTALQKAEDVIDQIYEWMECGQTQACETRHVRALEKAVERAREWNSLNQAVTTGLFGNKASEKEIRERVSFNDGADRIIQIRMTIKGAAYFTESLESAKAMIDRVSRQNDERFDVSEIQQDIDGKREKIDEKKAEFKALVIRQRNGEISERQVKEKAPGIKAVIDRLESEIARLQKRMEDRLADEPVARQIEGTMKDIYYELSALASNPAELAKSMEKLGVGNFHKFINGSLKPKELEAFLNGILDVRARKVAKTNTDRKTANEIEKIIDMVDRHRQKDAPTSKADNEKLRQEQDSAYAELLGDTFGNEGAGEVETEEEEEEKLRNKGKPYSDGDI